MRGIKPYLVDIESINRQSHDYTTESFEIHVVTPMFGSGVQAGVNDPLTLIRGTSIRGHLRFWWRATRGAGCSTAKELYDKESSIWGSTKRGSEVSVYTRVIDEGTQLSYSDVLKSEHKILSYALFPFKEEKSQNRAERKGRQGISFELQIRFHNKVKDDVRAAMWAWINFGGLGSRTRRGTGALYCNTFSPTETHSNNLKDWYATKFKEYVVATEQKRPWPTLNDQNSFMISSSKRPAMKSWGVIISKYQEFRQNRNKGQKDPRRPGRSRWPEADSLRMLLKAGDTEHMGTITTQEPAFPRAELGLPIEMKFMGADQIVNSTILPAGNFKRMGSPLILKPLAISKEISVPIALRLSIPPLQEVRLERKTDIKLSARDVTIIPNQTRIADKSLVDAYEKSPLKKSKQGSAIEAFFSHLREANFE